VVPIDYFLLVAAALTLAFAIWRPVLAPWLRTTLRLLAYPVILLGAADVAFSLADVYMVRVANVIPGDPMGMDELAYPVRDAVFGIARGIGLLFLAFFIREHTRRTISAGS
jgi:hypothetical protein